MHFSVWSLNKEGRAQDRVETSRLVGVKYVHGSLTLVDCTISTTLLSVHVPTAVGVDNQQSVEKQRSPFSTGD